MEGLLKDVRSSYDAPLHESVHMAALRKLNKNDIKIMFRNASDSKPAVDLFHFLSDQTLTFLYRNPQKDLQDTKNRPRDSSDPYV